MNSILTKIKRATASAEKAKVEQETPKTPAERARAPKNPPRPAAPTEIPGWKPTRTRGRPRLAMDQKVLKYNPISEFMEACLLPDLDACEFIGEKSPRPTVRNKYHRMPLADAYRQFCREKGYPLNLPTSFGTLIIKHGQEFGWNIIRVKAGETRRFLLKGVCLKGQQPWNGEDRGLTGRPDRRRWIKNENAT